VSRPARSRQSVTTVPEPWRVVTSPSASRRGKRGAKRQSIHAEGERELSLGRDAGAREQSPRKDLAPKAIRDGVDYRRPSDGREGRQRLAQGRMRGKRRGRHAVLEWFNHFARLGAARNLFRTTAARARTPRRRCYRAARANDAPSRPELDDRSPQRHGDAPDAEMRAAMAGAPVGDDVFGEDPSVRALEEEVASITAKESALFVPSGTMGNQLAIACLTRPGDEVIIGEGAHIAFYEVGAGAALSGVQFVVAGAGGFFSPGELAAAAKPTA